MNKPDFPHWPLSGNKRWDDIGCAIEIGNLYFGIGPNKRINRIARTRTADSRLSVAARALVGVKTRPEAVVGSSSHNFDFLKPVLPIREELERADCPHEI